jgi:uncharacterized LabA/DUF88 family protein
VNGDRNLAVFCDFENIALGARDAKYASFDMQLVLQRLLLKGSIVLKKAYCDWDRYKEFKATMHEAAFELIDIPHTRQSGKNSADIRMVVDTLDLCYTKEHINTLRTGSSGRRAFVIVSGDSDFSPLVSKLRENAKTVIGVGVKRSTSDLLISNCDEFIFYDDLAGDVHVPFGYVGEIAALQPLAVEQAPGLLLVAEIPLRCRGALELQAPFVALGQLVAPLVHDPDLVARQRPAAGDQLDGRLVTPRGPLGRCRRGRARSGSRGR